SRDQRFVGVGKNRVIADYAVNDNGSCQIQDGQQESATENGKWHVAARILDFGAHLACHLDADIRIEKWKRGRHETTQTTREKWRVVAGIYMRQPGNDQYQNRQDKQSEHDVLADAVTACADQVDNKQN